MNEIYLKGMPTLVNLVRKLRAYVQLIRPINAFMMGFAVVVGAFLTDSVKALTLPRQVLLGFLTSVFLTGASMAINDYYDREIDAINEPSRPIPSGFITPKNALAFALLLTIFGLTAAFFTNLECGLAALLAWLVTSTYVTIGKRTGLPGNFMVSFCVALPFLYGSLAMTRGVSLNVGLFAAMAFLSNTGREINKGIVDVAGDKERNIQTVAVRFGNRAAAALAAVFYLSAVSLSVLPLVWNLVSWWFIPFVAATDFGLILSSFMLLRNPSRENARKIKKAVLVFFFLGLLGFIAGSI
jgi:geranylgeranylglycerol-phosphate geranylgeranyltransferase